MDTVQAFVDWQACTATQLSGVSWLKGSSKTPATDYGRIGTNLRFCLDTIIDIHHIAITLPVSTKYTLLRNTSALTRLVVHCPNINILIIRFFYKLLVKLAHKIMPTLAFLNRICFKVTGCSVCANLRMLNLNSKNSVRETLPFGPSNTVFIGWLINWFNECLSGYRHLDIAKKTKQKYVRATVSVKLIIRFCTKIMSVTLFFLFFIQIA